MPTRCQSRNCKPAAVHLCLLASLILAGCAYVGEPLPPALNIARPVQDLSMMQLGERLLIRFTLPQQTTEDLPLVEPGEIELLVGLLTPGEFSWQSWEQGAKRFPVTLAAGGSTAEAAAPFADWVGSEVAAAVRLINRKGRRSAWSNLVRVRLIPPLPPPDAVTAGNIAEGVRVSFKYAQQHPDLKFRILRRAAAPAGAAPTDETLAAEEVASTSWVDGNVKWGIDYRYTVIAGIRANDVIAESLPVSSNVVKRTDEFPPAVPKTVTAIGGLGSVELTWERVGDEDLAGFRIYRALEGEDFVLLTELPLQFAYGDRQVESGKRYRYAISAFDQAENESARTQAVEAQAP